MEILENPLVVEILLVVITALMGLVVFGGRQLITLLNAYLAKKLGLEEYAALKEFAETQVRALMQSPAWKDLASSEKKEMAMVAMYEYTQKRNIAISREQLDALVEATVQRVKAEFGQETLG